MSVVASLLHSLRFLVRSHAALHLEIVALRHQLVVANRSRRPRLLLTALDRVLWTWLAHRWRGWRSAPCRAAGDRPRMASSWFSSVLDLEEPTSHWPSGGITRCPRVDSRDVDRESTVVCAAHSRGAAEAGISVSESPVAKYMRRHPRPPSQTWRTFLTNHASQIIAADLFVVPTVTFRLLFVLVILAHDRRQIVQVAVTAHPTAPWTAQQLRNAFPENEAPQYLLHDRDSVFAHVATTLEGMTIREVRTAPRSPWQKDYASYCTSLV